MKTKCFTIYSLDKLNACQDSVMHIMRIFGLKSFDDPVALTEENLIKFIQKDENATYYFSWLVAKVVSKKANLQMNKDWEEITKSFPERGMKMYGDPHKIGLCLKYLPAVRKHWKVE